MSMDVVTAGDARHVAGVVAGITGLHPGIFILYISPPIPYDAIVCMYVQWGVLSGLMSGEHTSMA